MNFTTWKATNVKAEVCGCVFFVPVTPSVSELVSVCSDGCSAHCHQVHPVSFSVSLQASRVRGRLIPCMLTVGTEACTQNTRKYLECLKSIKGHMETCEQKKMEGDAFVECLTSPSRVVSLNALTLSMGDGTPVGHQPLEASHAGVAPAV